MFGLSVPCEVKVLVAQTCLTLCGPWTVARQAPLSMEFFRQEHWSGLPCRAVLEGIFPTQGSDPGFLHCRIFCCLRHQGSPSIS